MADIDITKITFGDPNWSKDKADKLSLCTLIHDIKREYDKALRNDRNADPQFAVEWAESVALQIEEKIPSAQDRFNKWMEER